MTDDQIRIRYELLRRYPAAIKTQTAARWWRKSEACSGRYRAEPGALSQQYARGLSRSQGYLLVSRGGEGVCARSGRLEIKAGQILCLRPMVLHGSGAHGTSRDGRRPSKRLGRGKGGGLKRHR
jgi:hypothetical protein